MREDDKKTRTRPDAHVGEDQLINYQLGRLSGVDRDLVQYHLLDCDECVATFRNVQDFFEPPTPSEKIPEGVSETQWASFWSKVGARGGFNEVAPASRFKSGRRGLTLAAIAAVLLVALALTAVWAVSLRRERRQLLARLQELNAQPPRGQSRSREELDLIERVKELEQENLSLQEKVYAPEQGDPSQRPPTTLPQAEPHRPLRPELNLPIYDLYPEGSAQRSGDEGGAVRVPAQSKTFILILNGQGLATYPDHRLDIVNQKGQVVWAGNGLRRDGFGNFVMSLDRRFLSRGLYRLSLYGLDAQGSRLIAEYLMHVEL